MLYKIYHNSRCGKSRDALNFLKTKENIEIEVIEYLKKGIDKGELKSILKKLNIPVSDVIRKNEQEFGEYKNKNLTDDELIDLVIKIPKLLQRPIVISGDKAVIGRPIKNVIDLVEN